MVGAVRVEDLASYIIIIRYRNRLELWLTELINA